MRLECFVSAVESFVSTVLQHLSYSLLRHEHVGCNTKHSLLRQAITSILTESLFW